MVIDFGASDNYREIISGSNKYLIRYLENKESYDYLYEMISKEIDKHDIYKNEKYIPLFSTRCRCGLIYSYDDKHIFNGKHQSHLITYKEIELNNHQNEIRNMISIDVLKDLLKDKCPYYYLDNPKYILI